MFFFYIMNSNCMVAANLFVHEMFIFHGSKKVS